MQKKLLDNSFKGDDLLSLYSSKTPAFWNKQQEAATLSLFKKMSTQIPAYKAFLKTNKINSAKISKYEDLKQVPAVDKGNYFKKYSFAETLWPKAIDKQSMVLTSTSGSTGTPTYFFRGHFLDIQYSVLAEYFLKNGPKGATLVVDCFGMGVWIGGLMTYQAFRYAGLRGYPVSIITPGINKDEIFKSIRNLSPHFKNVILTGYPPFIKDVVDEFAAQKIDPKKFNLRLMFAAESFTEAFRDNIAKVGKVKNVYNDTLNIYGSAELGAMAYETPTSILIRRLASKNKALYAELFNHDRKFPTLAQFNPALVSFEVEDGSVLISADSAAPFMKYRIGDNGGVFTFDEVNSIFNRYGIDLGKEAKKNGVTLIYLPFVYVHERSDFSTTFYGLQVYPQTIKQAIEVGQIQNVLSGKFTLTNDYDKKGDQQLHVHLECKPGKSASKQFVKKVEDAIVKALLTGSSEYKELTSMLSSKRTKPKLYFWEYNHDLHFKSGIKQRWLKK